jgi:TetR/AcrR family transcriptional regulator, regulator of cefoperazone and chloramphenicol sensitivity
MAVGSNEARAVPQAGTIQESAQGRKEVRPASRHYRRAQRDRGAETRTQLIEAALDVFGLFGFEGATTRDIAKRAGANLAAIVYHFGSKEALHLAVAEHVAGKMKQAVGTSFMEAANLSTAASPAVAKAMFQQLIATYVDVLIGSTDAERWARFIVREQMQPSTAFDVMYKIMSGVVEVATRLVATALGTTESEETKLRVFAMFGQVLVFRVSQALILRRMGWATIGERERAEIKRVIISHTETILETGARP